MFDLVIRNGTIVSPRGLRSASIGVRDGEIASIADVGTQLDGTEVLDAERLHIFPGLIDTHAHHREPGFTHKEDIVTATQACAAGGVTTTFAMPNVNPPPNTVERLAAMLDLYQAKAIVDWNVNPAATLPDEIPRLADLGIAAFKVFMVVDTGRAYPHMPGIGIHDHGELMAVFERVAQTGLPLMVHPHDQSAMRHIETEYWNRGERDFRAYARAYASHAGIVFDLASAVLLRLQEAVGTRLHILHIQTRRMIEQLAAAKARGQAVTAEINPWALFLSNDWATVERLGSYALGYWVPEVNVEPLWDALRDGTVDLIGTDHAPHLAEEKEAGWTDGWKAHTGTPSAEFYFPLLLDAAHRGQISLEQVSRITSAAPASVFRLARKGRVEVGADADLAIVDLDKEWEIRDERVRSKCGWTPYAGRRVRGAVRTTIVRGRVVYDGVNVIGSPGWGRQAMPT